MRSGGGNWDGAAWHEASTEARGALREATEWHLTEPRWQQVQRVVGNMGDAVVAADPQLLWGAITQLEELGPLRVSTRLGDQPRKPLPPDVRERINEIIDSLGSPASSVPGDQNDGEQDSGQERGTPAH